MSVKIQRQGSRLKHADLVTKDGYEWWDRPRLPEIPIGPGDKQHPVKEGERLDTIAKKYYRKGSYRWVLAHANGMGLMTLYITVGSKIRIPDPATLRRIGII